MPYQPISASEVADNELRFKRLADSGIIGVFEVNGRGQIVTANDAFLGMLGYPREDLESGSMRWSRIAVPGYEQVNRSFREQLESTGAAAPAELEYFRKDGSRLPLLMGLASTGDKLEKRLRSVSRSTSPPPGTHRKALRGSEEQFRQLTDNIREVFWIMNAKGTELVYLSPAYREIWGRTCESAYADPDNWVKTIHPEDRQSALDAVLPARSRENPLRTSTASLQPSGAVRWIRERAFLVQDDKGRTVRIAGVSEDINGTQAVRSCSWARQALYDELTDLPNRRLFRERLALAVSRCQQPGETGAVLFIDLDNFKLVNDTLGHSAGDLVLAEVSRRLLAVCPEASTVARFGGDEFMVVTTGFGETRFGALPGRTAHRLLWPVHSR